VDRRKCARNPAASVATNPPRSRVAGVGETPQETAPMPKRVAIELVERAGINVEKLLEMLVRNAAAELTTFYYYTILRVNLIGLEGEGLKQIAEDARIEDRNHFEALVPRIHELGGHLPSSMVEFHNI
jgi:ferritin-like protein